MFGILTLSVSHEHAPYPVTARCTKRRVPFLPRPMNGGTTVPACPVLLGTLTQLSATCGSWGGNLAQYRCPAGQLHSGRRSESSLEEVTTMDLVGGPS